MKRNPPAQPVLEPVREQPGAPSDESELKRTIAKITQGARSSHHLSLISEEEERMRWTIDQYDFKKLKIKFLVQEISSLQFGSNGWVPLLHVRKFWSLEDLMVKVEDLWNLCNIFLSFFQSIIKFQSEWLHAWQAGATREQQQYDAINARKVSHRFFVVHVL